MVAHAGRGSRAAVRDGAARGRRGVVGDGRLGVVYRAFNERSQYRYGQPHARPMGPAPLDWYFNFGIDTPAKMYAVWFRRLRRAEARRSVSRFHSARPPTPPAPISTTSASTRARASAARARASARSLLRARPRARARAASRARSASSAHRGSLAGIDRHPLRELLVELAADGLGQIQERVVRERLRRADLVALRPPAGGSAPWLPGKYLAPDQRQQQRRRDAVRVHLLGERRLLSMFAIAASCSGAA